MNLTNVRTLQAGSSVTYSSHNICQTLLKSENNLSTFSLSHRQDLRVKVNYVEHKELRAAQGVKICAKELDKASIALIRSAVCYKVARWQNLIPSFPWIAPGWRAGVGAIVQKPEGPNTYNLKIRLYPSGNLDYS